VEIDQRIPDLSDKELENLHANALRLEQSGSQMQRQHAERLLPLLSAAMEERRAAKLQAQQEKKASGVAARKSAKAAKTAAKVSED
jgi:peptidoglycan hydrolase CwlO-like protein